jgi:hypothetical protein
MRTRLLAITAATVLGCALAFAVAVTPAGAASAPRPESAQASASLTLLGASLGGVAVLSPGNVWAVGTDNGGLIAHWNGGRWSYLVMKSVDDLQGIAAVSPSDIWAVGSGVILHWNGHRWSLARYPSILFYSVAASSADNVWVGGSYSADSAPSSQNVDAALLHWTGRKWYVVPVGSPKGSPLDAISSLAVTGPRSAWASAVVSQSGGQVILLHWNGVIWRPVTRPAPGTASDLVQVSSVAAAPHGTVWAFGWATAGLPVPQIMYWDGRSWRNESGPLGQQAGFPDGCFARNGTGWAIGDATAGQAGTGVSHWTGRTWTAAPVKVAGIKGFIGFGLDGCSALSGRYAWAVGSAYSGNGSFYSLALFWNGKVWS